MSPTPGEPACSSVKEEIEAFAVPDSARFDRRFFPRDRLRALLSKSKVQKVLNCPCPRCEWHKSVLGRRANPLQYLDRIVGRTGEGQHPASTAIELLALLINIRYPSFITGFLQQDCNDHVLTTHKSGFTENVLKRTYWSQYDVNNPKESSILATKFRSRMYQFAVPQMNDDQYSVYDEWTIFPFFNEKTLGKMTEDGEFLNEGAHSRVVSFEIWEEYRNLPHATQIRKFARKELNDSSSIRFHHELDNLERVRRLQDDHIIKVLKAYKHGDKFVLLFPCAKTNLHMFLREPRFEQVGTDTEVWESNPLWQQMLGITNALRRIVDYKDPTLAPDDQLYGYHFDLKPENILVEDSGTLVITDFGQAWFKRSNGTSSNIVGMGGTEGYAPPEIDDPDMAQNRKYDVFSLGCILLEIATFVVKRHIGMAEFDGLRLTKIPGTNREDDRFFQKGQDGSRYEIKPQILRWMDDLPSSGQAGNTKSKDFMTDVMMLAKQMLEVKVHQRLEAKGVLVALKHILATYQTFDALSQELRGNDFEPGPDEIELGRHKMRNMQNSSYQDKNGSWQRTKVRVFGEHPSHLRIVTSTTSASRNTLHSVTGHRTGIKLIPTYALHDRVYYRFLDGHIYFSRMHSSDPTPFGGAKYSFDPLDDAIALQGTLTGQDIVRSYSITRAGFVVSPTLTRRIKDVCTRPKGMQQIVAGQTAWTAQLWNEADSGPNPPGTPRPNPAVRSTASLLAQGPASRRIVVYFDKAIVTLHFAKNLRVQQRSPECDAKVLRLVPTDVSKDASFAVSVLSCTNDEPLPGIPLCKTMLHEAEEKERFGCKSFDLHFKSAEDLQSFHRKYQSLKRAWKIEAQEIEQWKKSVGYRTGYTLD